MDQHFGVESSIINGLTRTHGEPRACASRSDGRSARGEDVDRLEAQQHTIYLARHGSQAYDLATPTSDEDFKGVLVPAQRYVFGFKHRFEQFETHEPDDLVIYTLPKFFKLATACNPSIIEVLFVEEEDIVSCEPEGELLRQERDRFLSQRAHQTFTGYALSQLKRIQTHRGWLLNPPEGEPTRADFDLPAQPTLPSAQIGAASAVIERQGTSGFDTNFLDMLDREKRWRAAHKYWKQYNQWKKHRNPARAKLEAHFGYDCKHGSHLLRLLRMGEEILVQGKVLVRRPDREELLDIKLGRWPYERLMEEANATMDRIKKLMEKPELLAVPAHPDEEALDALCMDLMIRWYRRKGVVGAK